MLSHENQQNIYEAIIINTVAEIAIDVVDIIYAIPLCLKTSNLSNIDPRLLHAVRGLPLAKVRRSKCYPSSVTVLSTRSAMPQYVDTTDEFLLRCSVYQLDQVL